MSRNDPDRIRHAKLSGAAAGLRDQVMLADAEALERCREELPRVWEFIDSVCELT